MSNNVKILAGLIAATIIFLVVVLWPESAQVPEPTISEPVVEMVATSSQKTMGTSVEGRDIKVFSFGNGDTHLLFVGGVHGGYEWNSIILAEEFIAALQNEIVAVPQGVTIDVIPNLNPDGYAKHLDPVANYTDAAKRFNANGVDLNRNFDCRWQPTSTWRGNEVSAGTAAFSEPEAAALRDFVLETNPSAAIFWHSVANNVYGSECGNGVLPMTKTILETYARAASYGEVLVFDAYPVSGDAEGWLASIGIPAITVELETRDSSEWERNKKGIEAVLNLHR